MVATTIVNQRWDEAVHELRVVLDRLGGVEDLTWLDSVSRPFADGPNPRDEVAVRAHQGEANLALARALLAQQERIEELEKQLRKRTKCSS